MKSLRPYAPLAALLLILGMHGTASAATATRTSAFEYDPATGLLTREIIEPDQPQLRLETSYVHDAYGNKVSTTVSSPATGLAAIAPRTSTTTHDARGQFPTAATNALGHRETRTFDPSFGSVTSLTGPNGLTTQWQYDSLGRKILEIRADGTRTKWDYLYCNGIAGGTAACPSLAQYLIQTTPLSAGGAANGPYSKTYYDALDRPIRTETLGFDGNLIYQDTQYDHLGRIERTSRPYRSGQTPRWTVMTYDALGRVIATTHPDNTRTTVAYNGLSTSTTNSLGQTQTALKNSQGQTVKVTDAASNSLTYQHDPFGNLTKTTDPKGNVVTLGYDGRGRKTSMTDPDMGHWRYEYNALGELVKQTDAKNQVSTMTYDKLGRLTQRAEPDLVSVWTYDNCAKGIGKLCKATTDNGYSRVHNHDSLGRPASTTTTLDTAYTASVSYDANGRVATQTYPTGLAVRYVYTSLGYLKEVRNHSTSALYWRADTQDEEGRLLQQTYGNNIVTQQVFDSATGRIKNIYAGAGNSVQHLSFSHDSIGNLLSRNDTTQNLSETFLYDSLNRLTRSTVNSGGAGVVTQTYAYDSTGNIVSRSGVGSYTYGAVNARPHAVTQVALTGGGKRVYGYDAVGNMISDVRYDANNNVIAGSLRTHVYTSFHMPQALGAVGLSLAFAYGPEHQRVKQIAPSATTIYLHPDNAGGLSYEKDLKADGGIEHRHFISAGGQVVAMVKQTGTTTKTLYFHRDNLGSTTAITDEAGNVIERLAYEPFGKRRFAAGNTDPNDTIKGIHTDRGYTNHEHLDELGLIHMNGRIYDPWLGRFMSADPLIQAPANLQSYNRYSYVMNSPFVYTDPTGFSAWSRIRRIVVRAVAAVADVYGCSGYCSAAVGAYQGYKQGGWGGAAIGGMAGYVGYQMGVNYPLTDSGGSIIWRNVATVAAVNATFGCASAEAAGGSCGRGALAGAAGTVGAAYGYMGAIIAGCAAGKVGGGSCRDGAFSALETYAVYSAIGYLIEAQSTGTPDSSIDESSTQLDSDSIDGMQVAWITPEEMANPRNRRLLESGGGGGGGSFSAGVGRSGALNAAKRDLGIPRAQHPDAVNRVPMTDRNGKSILGVDGKPIMTREYTYTRPGGGKVVVQDHSAGHKFGQGGIGDQGAHFNVRPPQNTRTGSVPGTRDHYSW